MSKNREYTGLERTPSSMSWLIRKRSVIKGMLEKHEQSLASLPSKIEDLKAQLKALDDVFSLHEVEVDPSIIRPTRPKRKRLTVYGGMTTAIYEFLRENQSRGPLFTSEIALYVARKCKLALDKRSMRYVVKRVGKRLQTLAKNGEIDRHHDPTDIGQNDEGRWSLQKSDID